MALLFANLAIVDAAEESRISDEPAPLRTDDVPDRPRPILEIGDGLLGTGPLGKGFELPGGAVWRPSLFVFGTLRSAVQTFDSGIGPDSRRSEWANRLDLFGQVGLSPTERILVGMRSPDPSDGDYWGCPFEPGGADCQGGSPNLRTAFFEGDFGEIFPNLDLEDRRRLDIGFAVGRQMLLFQDGLLLNDEIDAVGITRNNIFIPGTSNTRATFVFGWNEVSRRAASPQGAFANDDDGSAMLYGLFFETDTRRSTINVDLAYVDSNPVTGDLFTGGISAAQRFGLVNTTFRLLGSYAVNGQTPESQDGAVPFVELSWTPPHGHDLVYLNAFYGFDHFRSAARGRVVGGPLGRVGILFAAVGLGRYGAPLGSDADERGGGVIGYQKFFDGSRKQIVLELGGRQSTDNGSRSAVALGGRYQQAIGGRFLVVVEAFAGHASEPGDDGATYGSRLELLAKF